MENVFIIGSVTLKFLWMFSFCALMYKGDKFLKKLRCSVGGGV